MPDFGMIPEPKEDPEEKSLAVELASFEITFCTPGLEMLGRLTQKDIEEFRESHIKPVFVRAQLEIEQKLGDVLEVRNIKLRQGSIIVDALLFALIEISNNPIVSGPAGGLLTAILIRKLDSPNQKKQYKELMQKISEIIRIHAEDLSGGDFDITNSSIPIYNPKLKAYHVERFEFHSKDIVKLQKDVEMAINNYHNNIGKS